MKTRTPSRYHLLRRGGPCVFGMDAEAVIPSNRCRKVAIPHDTIAYKHRKKIERCFSKLKYFRRFATRYDRRTIHFTGFVHLAAAMIWLR